MRLVDEPELTVKTEQVLVTCFFTSVHQDKTAHLCNPLSQLTLLEVVVWE
jgi:hypothetical protein